LPRAACCITQLSTACCCCCCCWCCWCQVYELQAELDGVHTHYQQLLDRLVPRWRHDRAGLEVTQATTTAAAAAAAAAAAVNTHPTVSIPAATSSNASSNSSSQKGGSAFAPLSSPTISSKSLPTAAATPTTTTSSSSSSSSSGHEAVRSMLEGQLEGARRDLRSAQHSTARLEADMAAAAELAAGREAALSTQVSFQRHWWESNP